MGYRITVRSKVFALAVLFAFFLVPGSGWTQDNRSYVPDKELCDRMIRMGKEAYARGKYLDAKEYFRKAVQADPENQTAWQFYDLSAVFALAEKVEQNADLITPGKSVRTEPAATGPAEAAPEPSPPPKTEPKKKFEFKIVDDEGC